MLVVAWAFLVNDYATDSDGRIHLNGMFNTIRVAKFPYKITEGYLHMHLVFKEEDIGKRKQVYLEHYDGPKKDRGGRTFRIDVKPRKWECVNASLKSLVLKTPGVHCILIKIRGHEDEYKVPFYVVSDQGKGSGTEGPYEVYGDIDIVLNSNNGTNGNGTGAELDALGGLGSPPPEKHLSLFD